MEKTSREFTEDAIVHQCNIIHIAQRYGYNGEGDIRELAEAILDETLNKNDPLYGSLLRIEDVRRVFIRHLEKTLKPLLYGISRSWRKTQEEALSAHIKSFDRGYVRLLSEIPTGAGKSMLIGALVRAALDTMKELGLDFEIQIFTSRVAIAGQLVYEEIPDEEKGDDPLEVGKKGDVRLWCPELSDEHIRVLAGTQGSNPRELAKNSIITVSTYQGLRAGRISQHFRKPVFITICDESHRVTERVAMLLEQLKSFVVGLSATVLGPERDPFVFFERIERSETKEKRKTYIDDLCYHKSIAEMIRDQELKPVRWINARRIKINIADAKLQSGSKGMFDVFNESSVARILSRNPELGVEVISEAYLGEHLGLELSNSRPIWQRRGICFVDRIAVAKDCAEMCNKLLPEKLKAKYGPQAYFKAGYVDGTMTHQEYEGVVHEFRVGRITLLFSAEKIGEGVDFPFVDLIIPLRVLGFGSQWKLVQGLGRGLRFDKNNPTGDLVVLDLVFESDRHLLASVLGIFGRSSLLSGGLLAGWGSSYELEKKVFELLRKCKNWTELWGKLSPEEQVLFPFIKQKVVEEKMRGMQNVTLSKSVRENENILSLTSIDFIEQDDVRFALSLGNHAEMAKYAVEILASEGYTSAERLRGVYNMSLQLFCRKRFGNFRDGLTMVSLIMEQNHKVITSEVWASFIKELKAHGLPEGTVFLRRTTPPAGIAPTLKFKTSQNEQPGVKERKKHPARSTIVSEGTDYAIEKLIGSTRELFGVDPEFRTTFKDLFVNPFHTAQAAIVLPEGLKFASPICRHEDEEKAKQGAAAELHKALNGEMKNGHIMVYRGTPLYSNHLKALRVMLHECNFGNVEYTITEREGLFVVQASCQKTKKFLGNPAVHQNERVAKEHAEVMLAIDIMDNMPEFQRIADVHVTTRPDDSVRLLCSKLKLPFKKSSAEIKVGNYMIAKVTMTSAIYEKTAFGISFLHAEKRAAKKLYEVLKDLSYEN